MTAVFNAVSQAIDFKNKLKTYIFKSAFDVH